MLQFDFFSATIGIDIVVSDKRKQREKSPYGGVTRIEAKKALVELLAILKELDSKHETGFTINSSLTRILTEDKELLAKLAQ